MGQFYINPLDRASFRACRLSGPTHAIRLSASNFYVFVVEDPISKIDIYIKMARNFGLWPKLIKGKYIKICLP